MAVYFPDTHPPATLSFVANGFVVTPRQVELYGECDLLLTNRNAYDFEIRPSIIRVSHNGTCCAIHSYNTRAEGCQVPCCESWRPEQRSSQRGKEQR